MCFGDKCKEIPIDRRSFLAGGAAALAAHGLGHAQNANPRAKLPATRVLDSPEVALARVVFKHNGAPGIDGHLARPKKEGVYPAVVVVAGNKITEEYIPNTCAALALAGFVGLAPNVFHPLPDDTPNNNEVYAKYIANHTGLDRLDDIQAGVSYLRTLPFVSSGGIGSLGFCRGGREAMLFGARSREVDAVVAFHPSSVKAQEVLRLKNVPVQLHHGTADESVSVTESQKTEKMLRAQGTPVELFLYEGANHGFLAYTRPFYQEQAAELAWARTVRFLRTYLR